ncbi:MAG: 4-hydroxy-3-methylbut-2-enyl diphosphate reductase [Bacteroidales bacterium]
MVIEIDENSGFCFGVRNAVETAEKALMAGEKIFSLGQIVHNDIEVERLSKMGLKTINYAEFRSLQDCKVLIRAHGEPPETYRIAKENGITLIDATCPIVKRLQQKIRQTWEETKIKGGQVVIYGKPGHAEVLGLIGQTDNNALLTDGEINLDRIDFSKKIHLFSQTTMNPEAYEALAEKMRKKIKEYGEPDPGKLLTVHRTICTQVSHRQPHLESFARSHDIIIFVSGKESSNGKMLFSICKNVNPESYFVSSPGDIKKEWFIGKQKAGICGATSTPGWLIRKVSEAISSFNI